MIRRAGGVDALATSGARSTVVAPATLRASGAEVVIIAPCGYDLARARRSAESLLATPSLGWLSDGPAVWALDANALISRPGPRLIDGIEQLSSIFHPALFPAPRVDLACRLR